MDRDETYRQQTEHCIAWDPVMAYLEDLPDQATAKASVPQTLGCVPWVVAPQGRFGGMVGLKPIDFYALSWGVPRKPA
jgi:hypothetical protein